MRRTLETVVNQTLKPSKWIIVDDGSTDQTPEILKTYSNNYDFIEIVTRRDRGTRKVGPGVIEAFYEGLGKIDLNDYEYLCKLDLDLELPLSYFEKLVLIMESNPRVGTFSGKPYYRSSSGKLVSEKCGDEHSVGMTKFYRVSCFKQIGGFIHEVMWDAIDSHRCRRLGWISGSINDTDLRFIHLRPMGSSQKNIITGRIRHGYGQYFMGTSFIFMLASTLYRLFHPPIITGAVASLWGYIKSGIYRVERFDDPETIEFIKEFQLRSLFTGKSRAIAHYNSSKKNVWNPEKKYYDFPRS